MYKNNIAIISPMQKLNADAAHLLAERLGMYELDFEKFTEYEFGMSLREIIAEFGKPFYLDACEKYARRMRDYENTVIACSSAFLLSSVGVGALSETAYMIALSSPAATMFANIEKDNGAFEDEIISDLMRKGSKIKTNLKNYSDFIVQTQGKTYETVTEEIVAYFKEIV